MRMPSTAPRVTGTSLPPTATALRTEAATACRAAGRGDVQWDGQPSPPSTAGKQGTQVNTAPGGVQNSPPARGVWGASELSGFFRVLAFARGPAGL